MKKGFISVIVPIYKVEKYLRRCVNSILRQSYTKLEILLIDDGSPDACPEICEAYAKTDSRVRVIHKENGGLSSARNTGLEIAEGEYIAFVDGDDYIHSEMLKQLYHALKDTDADLSVCNLQYVNEEGYKIPTYPDTIIENELLNADEVFLKSQKNFGYYYIVVWNKLYKRKLWESYRFREGKLHEDEFAFHHIIGQCHKISCISDVGYYYVQRAGSIMSRKTANRTMDCIEAFLERIDYMKQENIGNGLPNLDKECSYKLCDVKKMRKTREETLRFRTLKERYASLHKWVLNNTNYPTMLKIKRTVYRHVPFLQKLFGITKEELKKIRWQYKKQKFLHSSNLKKFRQDKSPQRAILIDTPTHGNLGDQAIALAEQKFITECLGYSYYEFTHEEYKAGRNVLLNSVRQEDILFIPGGGFIGTLWQNEEDILISILETFHKNNIFIFPQTVYFEKTRRGDLEKKRFNNAIKKCRKLKIFVRDKESYRIMTEELHMTNRQCFLAPDIVTYLEMETVQKARNGVLFCMRSDKEKISDEKKMEQIQKYCLQLGETVCCTDTIVKKRIGKRNRKKTVRQKLLEFSCAKLVITDRIHGMLFAALTGTPCIALDNVSGKVSGAYEWIRHLDYIQFVEEQKLTKETVNNLLKMQGGRYSNRELSGFYSLMKKEITS